MSSKKQQLWQVLVLAAGRGRDDPMARAFGVEHKCLLEVGGMPMLARVIKALRSCLCIGDIFISVDDPFVVQKALGDDLSTQVHVLSSSSSAVLSVLDGLENHIKAYPVLVTTADHALLNQAMLDHFLAKSDDMDADLCVAVARRERVLESFAQAKRTWLRFGPDAVTSCNLFAIKTPKALRAISFWQQAERNRKHPLKLARSFGFLPLLKYILGLFDLRGAFRQVSEILHLKARPVIMPMAEAAIDIDKPEDMELVRTILRRKNLSALKTPGQSQQE